MSANNVLAKLIISTPIFTGSTCYCQHAARSDTRYAMCTLFTAVTTANYNCQSRLPVSSGSVQQGSTSSVTGREETPASSSRPRAEVRGVEGRKL